MKPEIERVAGGYTFQWKEQHITISVSRIVVHKSDGRVTGELLIKTDKAGFSPILQPPTQLNFTSERTRTGLAKSLSEKFPSWEWGQIIDQLAYHVQELARQGEPIAEIWTSEEAHPPEWF